jgi:hypothetical protein
MRTDSVVDILWLSKPALLPIRSWPIWTSYHRVGSVVYVNRFGCSNLASQLCVLVIVCGVPRHVTREINRRVVGLSLKLELAEMNE